MTTKAPQAKQTIPSATRTDNHTPFFTPFIQPKLTINQPNDIYEQEADTVADKVMQMPETSVQREPFFKPSPSIVQRKFSHVEEEKLQRKTVNGSDAGMTAPPVVQHTISKGGQPLDTGAKIFMESRFGHDFGNVQIHNDSLAHRSAAEIHAKAYTHGNHIAFASGEYQPHTSEGKQLLAHELTHVVQQGKEVRRDTDDGSADDPGVDAVNDVITSLNETEETIKEEQDSESDPAIIAKDKRQVLLLDAWIDKLANNPDDFVNSNQSAGEYASTLTASVQEESKDESQTIVELIRLRGLAISPQAFLQNPFFNENMNAFLYSTLQTILPLVSPAQDEFSYNQREETDAENSMYSYGKTMSPFLFNNGLPLDITSSRDVSYFEVIEAKALRNAFFSFMSKPPASRSDFDFLLSDQGKQGDNDRFFNNYHYNWTSFFENAYNLTLTGNWIGQSNMLKNNIEDGSISKIDIPSLLRFQTQYPKGLSLQEFKNFSETPVSGSYMPQFDPFMFIAVAKTLSRLGAALHTQQFAGAEHQRFAAYLFETDTRIQALSGYDRYSKAIDWGIEKGFFSGAIKNMWDTLPGQLEDVLKDMAIRIGVEVGAKIVSGLALSNPVTATLAIAYQVWKLFTKYEDAKAILGIISLVEEAVSIINEARSATDVVGVQRSAARIAVIPQTLIPALIVQLGILGSQMAAKKIGAFAASNGGEPPNPLRPPSIPIVPPAEPKVPMGEPKILTSDPKLPGDAPKVPAGKPAPAVSPPSGEPKILVGDPKAPGGGEPKTPGSNPSHPASPIHPEAGKPASADPHAEPKKPEPPEPKANPVAPAYGTLPAGAVVGRTSPDYVVYTNAAGEERIRFRAEAAITWKEANPGRTYSVEDKAGIGKNNEPYVYEGRHRAIGAAHGDKIPANLGGVNNAPGWLDFKFVPGIENEPGLPVKDLTIDKAPGLDVSREEAKRRYEEKQRADKNQTSTAQPKPRFLTPAEGTGDGYLTPSEAAELQSIANRFKTTLYVVGSRAAGKGRNIFNLDLKPGKGKITRSDIDVAIDSQADIDAGGQLSHAIANAGKKAGKAMNIPGRAGALPKPPAIVFKPN